MAIPKKHSCSQDRALQMRMLDALDGLEELACVSAQQMQPEGLDILSIESAPTEDPVLRSARATIHHLPLKKKTDEPANIAAWLIQQEQQT
ncbi:hypothetical protein MNBD_GAMMA25-1668 [hydrothermal vent metagenome]|uniref:Uncharacterized protein n=1 Tax=hydrothermal vent metagenome TaxID=652676 RepID=A0A3B1C2R5_9ZZZZ